MLRLLLFLRGAAPDLAPSPSARKFGRGVRTAWVVKERLCSEEDAPREASLPTGHNTVVSFGNGQFYTNSGRPTGAYSPRSSAGNVAGGMYSMIQSARNQQ